LILQFEPGINRNVACFIESAPNIVVFLDRYFVGLSRFLQVVRKMREFDSIGFSILSTSGGLGLARSVGTAGVMHRSGECAGGTRQTVVARDVMV
jgi:hypothetical protein